MTRRCGDWVRQDGINGGEREGLTSGERERFREQGAGVERVMLYGFVDAQKADGFPVRLTCSVVGVSPSAYYAYRQRPQSGPAGMAEAALVDEIRVI